MNLFNERGCFGGGAKQSSPAPTPAPAPAPTPQIISPSEVESANTAEERRQKLNRMRSGLSSTIKTSAKGIAGSGADLMTQTLTGKEKLGA